MTRDNVRGKMTFKFENRKDGKKALVDIELDEIAMIEITNFIDGFYAGTKSVMFGHIYGSVEWKIADKIISRYIDLDSTTSRHLVYELLCKKLDRF
ncbi:MAG: hypothetical protein HFJ58_03380 [Clostridia bacterium]|nr:hypothetical protein [Clostridia bacterium]